MISLIICAMLILAAASSTADSNWECCQGEFLEPWNPLELPAESYMALWDLANFCIM